MRGLKLYGETGKFTWRMLATVLAAQSVVIFFGALVARGMATVEQGESRGTAYLLVGSGLAALCMLGAGVVRRPWGLTFGWLLQALTFLSAFVVPAMVIVGAIFLTLWLICLVQGDKVDRVQAEFAARVEAEEAAAAEGSGAGSRAADAAAPPVTPAN